MNVDGRRAVVEEQRVDVRRVVDDVVLERQDVRGRSDSSTSPFDGTPLNCALKPSMTTGFGRRDVENGSGLAARPLDQALRATWACTGDSDVRTVERHGLGDGHGLVVGAGRDVDGAAGSHRVHAVLDREERLARRVPVLESLPVFDT